MNPSRHWSGNTNTFYLLEEVVLTWSKFFKLPKKTSNALPNTKCCTTVRKIDDFRHCWTFICTAQVNFGTIALPLKILIDSKLIHFVKWNMKRGIDTKFFQKTKILRKNIQNWTVWLTAWLTGDWNAEHVHLWWINWQVLSQTIARASRTRWYQIRSLNHRDIILALLNISKLDK